jgi:hypothetical protein
MSDLSQTPRPIRRILVVLLLPFMVPAVFIGEFCGQARLGWRFACLQAKATIDRAKEMWTAP